MASEAVVSFVVDNLGKLLTEEAQRLHGVPVDLIKWMQEELMKMRSILNYADSKQKEDEEVRKWVAQIREICVDVDEFVGTIDGQTENRATELTVSVKRFFGDLTTRQKINKEFGRLKQKINDISRESGNYGIIMDFNEGGQEASSWIRDLEGRRRDSVMVEEPQLVGQHEEFRTVRDQLMTEEQRRHVISIFGIGGSGKTALAKKIFNDVKGRFDCLALVYVSQQCNIKDVFVSIIKDVAGDSAPEDIENLDVDDLGNKLRDEYLRGKRYLVVLDDIWTREAWDSLILKLPDDGNKSRVLVTTRIRDVALHADPSGHHHEMRLLNEGDSWKLFMKNIFPGEDPSPACPSELKEIGSKILKKCGGLPLAILVLGGLLARKDKKERAWSRVLENITESSKQCMDILALSYWDLPPYLKPCFLYFGLFPEDYEISSGKMIRLWIAEGFIEQRDGKIMEDVGEDYLKDLVNRSMIQVASKRSNGSIHKCRIHHLLRELSISKARENNFFTVCNDNDTSSFSTSVSRRAIYGKIDGDWTKNHSIENLRSLLYFFCSKVDVLKLPKTSNKLLRVMNVESEKGSKVSLPKEVGEFVHLKFLEFSRNYSISSIPPSIGKLSSLQTLKLGISGDVSSYHDTLPNCIEKLRFLRSLKLQCEGPIPPFKPFTHHLDLYKIYLCGSLTKPLELPPNLVELFLEDSELKQDAISTLEKLKHLKILKLHKGSYLSKGMTCSRGGFPQLELLELCYLPLEEWKVEEEAMKSLKSVKLVEMSALKTMMVPEHVRIEIF